MTLDIDLFGNILCYGCGSTLKIRTIEATEVLRSAVLLDCVTCNRVSKYWLYTPKRERH